MYFKYHLIYNKKKHNYGVIVIMNNSTNIDTDLDLDLDFIKHTTPALRSLINYYQKALPKSEFHNFIVDIKKLLEMYTQEFSLIPPGIERAVTIQLLIKRELERCLHIQYTCSKGCYYCCHFEVEVTQDEGELLAQIVLDGHNIDRKQLEIHAQREEKSSRLPILNPENRCIFLGEDNACTIYEYRPYACRKLIVSTPSIECSKDDGGLQPIILPLIETIVSAAINLPNNEHCSLSKSVLKAITNQK